MTAQETLSLLQDYLMLKLNKQDYKHVSSLTQKFLMQLQYELLELIDNIEKEKS